MYSDSESDDTLTSSDCTDEESSEDESDIEDDISECDAFSFTSFSVISEYSTVSKDSYGPRKERTGPKKRVTFKPGDSLVLMYEIPNRAMLGLTSASESSDDDYEDSDSDDDEEHKTVGRSRERVGCGKTKPDIKDRKLPKLLSVKQVTKRTTTENKTTTATTKRSPERVAKLIGLKITPSAPKQRKRMRKHSRENSDKTKTKVNLVCNGTAVESRKEKRQRRSRLRAIANNRDIDKTNKLRRNKSRLLEIKATVQSKDNTRRDTSSPTQRTVSLKQGIRPSVATLDDHGAISVCGKPLTQRAKLQPTSFRIAKREIKHSNKVAQSVKTIPFMRERQMGMRHCMSASYDSIKRLQADAITMQRITNSAMGARRSEPETAGIKRLDPDRMSATNKRNYAWQVANGDISSQSLRTPSIIPMWDNIPNGVSASNTIKLPT